MEQPSYTPFKHFQSLSVTISLAFLGLTVFILVLSTALGLFSSIGAQREVVGSEQEIITESAADSIRNFIDEQFTILEQAAFLNDVVGNTTERELVLSRILGKNEPFRHLSLFTVSGTELAHVSRLPSANDTSAEYEHEAIAKTQTLSRYISPIYIDPDTSEPLILFAIPVENLLQERVGVLVAEVNLKFLWNLVAEIKVGDEGRVYVVDRNGYLIAYEDVSRVLARENVASLLEVEDFLQSVDEEAESSEDITKGIEGGTVVTTHLSLGIPDWAVVVELPIREAYASVFRVLLYAFFIMVGSVIVAIITGVYISRRTTRPIQKLVEAAAEIAWGNLDIELKIPAQNEVGQLAEAFNAMVKRLHGAYHDLSDEKARLLASINSLSFGFIIASTDHSILLKNRALMDLFGFAPAENVTVDKITALLGGTFDVKKEAESCTHSGTVCMIREVEYGKKVLRTIISPIFLTDEGAELLGYVLLLEDITEAKIQERSRDEFFSIASHELRTPLTAIRGNSDMMLDLYKDKLVDADMKEMLRDINAASVRLINVVNDFLEVSRLEQGQVSFKKECFDVTEVTAKVARNMKSVVETRKLSIVAEQPKTQVPMVCADRDRVEQVLMNLVGNALKFTEQGGIVMRVELVGKFAKVQVVDTGIGISPQSQNLLFRKFQQAGDSTLARDVTQGTGLGLYISRLLVSAMGGTIALEKSEVGKGSIFSFTLPLF